MVVAVVGVACFAVGAVFAWVARGTWVKKAESAVQGAAAKVEDAASKL